MIQRIIYFEKDLRNVTEMYYKVVLTALKNNHVEIISLKDRNDKYTYSKKNDYYFVTTLKDFLSLYIKGHRNYIYWFQGIEPEERNLIKHNVIKYIFFSIIEKLALHVCKYKIGVSKYLFEHYMKKYHLNFNDKDCFIMPCFNTQLKIDSFQTKSKYDNNVFCYAGGMQPWQGVEYIFQIYEHIEQKHKDGVFLKIFSKDIAATKELISRYNIKNYSVQSVPQEEIDNELSTCKFGFIIRNNDIINNVATPTKLSAYIANGVIPIVSSTVKSFKDLSNQHKYICCLDDINELSEIELMLNQAINPQDVYKEFRDVFHDYYCFDKYVSDLQHYLSK